MPRIEVSEKQILESLNKLSPAARKEALKRLLTDGSYWESVLDRARPRIAAVAARRGLDWASLPEEERERLVDEVLHEDEDQSS